MVTLNISLLSFIYAAVQTNCLDYDYACKICILTFNSLVSQRLVNCKNVLTTISEYCKKFDHDYETTDVSKT